MATSSRNRKDYKLETQNAGISIPNTPFKATPMVANPVQARPLRNLGATPKPHPFKNGKPTI
jgi:hypothetical protein